MDDVRWACIWGAVQQVLAGSCMAAEPWDMLLLGRHRFGIDEDLEGFWGSPDWHFHKSETQHSET